MVGSIDRVVRRWTLVLLDKWLDLSMLAFGRSWYICRERVSCPSPKRHFRPHSDDRVSEIFGMDG